MGAIARSWEEAFLAGAREAFEVDRRNILALITQEKQRSLKEQSSINWQRLVTDAQVYLKTQGGENWRSTFTPLFQGVITDQADYWNTSFGMSFDVQNLYALQWFDEYKLTFSDFIITNTDNELSKLMQQGMYEGWSIPHLQQQIGGLFDQWMTGSMSDDVEWYESRLPAYRLELIARTETMRASNAGSFNLFRSWKAPYKEWLATGDDRTRPSHMDAWGAYSRGGRIGPIAIDEPFQVNGRDMMHPGDPAGGVEECANCRCALLPSFEGPTHTGEIHESQWNALSPHSNPAEYQALYNYWRDQIKALPFDERTALINYTGQGYVDINAWLRNGKLPDYMSVDDLLQQIDLISMGLGGANQNMLAFRGGIPADIFGYERFDEGVLSMLEGTLYQDMGFTSVSVDLQAAMGFNRSNRAFATVRIPQGTPGSFVESHTLNHEEFEFLLNQGTKFRIMEAFMDSNLVPGRTIPHLILEVVT